MHHPSESLLVAIQTDEKTFHMFKPVLIRYGYTHIHVHMHTHTSYLQACLDTIWIHTHTCTHTNGNVA